MAATGTLSPVVTGVDASTEVVAATFKVLVLGNSDVGKTSLIRLYATGEVAQNLLPTVGIDFTDVVVSVRRTKVKLRIWDTAGQERFHTFTKQFFRGAQGILLVYDVTSMASFQTLMRWIQTIRDVGLEHISLVVVGNKMDLAESRQVPRSNGERLASKHSYPYIETSAASGKNVKKAFYQLAESLIHEHGIFQPGQEAANVSCDSNDITGHHGNRTSPSRRDINDSFVLDDCDHHRKAKCCKS